MEPNSPENSRQAAAKRALDQRSGSVSGPSPGQPRVAQGRPVSVITAETHIQNHEFSGPIPPPDLLKAYRDVVPDGADRIIRMAEKEQSHRHSIESRIVEIRSRGELLGQIFGFTLGLSAVVGGLWLVNSGKQVTGLSSFFSGLAVLVGVYWYERRPKSPPSPPKAGPKADTK